MVFSAPSLQTTTAANPGKVALRCEIRSPRKENQPYLCLPLLSPFHTCMLTEYILSSLLIVLSSYQSVDQSFVVPGNMD